MEERCGIWQLEQLIAVGGLGEVWQARSADGELAALKRLHTHLLRHPAARALFEHERRLLNELPRHPGVVHGLGQGERDGRPWVAMRRVQGCDLRQIMEGQTAARGVAPQPRALPTSEALQVVMHAADAVAHLHDLGWVHGDVVPANLLVEGALPVVVLCDLGVSRRQGAAGPVQGTQAYMAPEQIRGEPWTAATDVFALGVVLWELLAGRRLYHRGPAWRSMQAIMEEDVPSLGDPALDELVAAALARDPARRLPNARKLAQSLGS